ncbi:MAG: lipid-A-disaccharide synthase [Victivallales bacterium]|nr:lipid-A-disaccharide synthase [Victivallales bacterium]
MNKIWIIAGEASGDLYGAELAKALKGLVPELSIRGMGGIQMKEAGVDIFVDSTELGVVGIIEVAKSVSFFLKLLKRMGERAASERPDLVVLIDYPGFNLRLAEKLHKLGIKVVYYISPQVWAWKKGRIPKIARDVTRMLCIFPFEPEVYAGTGLRTEFVGHPLLEILRPYRAKEQKRDENLVLLLPGSRGGELKRHIAPFLETANRLLQERPALHFAMPLPREKTKEMAVSIIEGCNIPEPLRSRLEVSVGNTRELMTEATAGLAASGTVTVEAAILGLPLVVAYKTNWLTYQIAKRLVKLPSITIANLVTGHTVYEECIQHDVTSDKMAPALASILPGGSRREEVLAGVRECVEKLGSESQVSLNVAHKVLEVLQE